MFRLSTNPTPSDFPRIETLALMMGFEFILVHSDIFMLVMPCKVTLLILIPVYGVVALLLNRGAENNLILYLYCGGLVSRLQFIFSKIETAERSRAIKLAIVAGLIYMLTLFAIIGGKTNLLSKGLNAEFLGANGYFDQLELYGIFTESPHLPIIMGIIHFSLMIVFEIFTRRRFIPKTT
ncbi:MAG: hypothetical protein EX271_10595 [Acidimicrobiales bacterium]|nr:MAG: hypothetical protein EX271_10595 [Acidimicrobiales bacterium]